MANPAPANPKPTGGNMSAHANYPQLSNTRPVALSTPLRNNNINIPSRPENIVLSKPFEKPPHNIHQVNSNPSTSNLVIDADEKSREENQPNLPAQPTQNSVVMKTQRVLKRVDSFDLYSFSMDDEELTAALDACESRLSESTADLGRPIETDPGIGGTIDFDEGTSGTAFSNVTNYAHHASEPQQDSRAVSVMTVKGKHGVQNLISDKDKTMQIDYNVQSSIRVGAEVSEEEFARQVIAIRQQRQAERSQCGKDASNVGVTRNYSNFDSGTEDGIPDNNILEFGTVCFFSPMFKKREERNADIWLFF